MRRVLAVLISVLTAVWPLLLPQPVSANPCGVTTAENGAIYAKAGHYFNQKGDLYADQSGYADGGNATGGIGGTGEGGFALNVNVQKAKGGEANNTPIAANVQLQAQKTEAESEGSNYANGGYSAAKTANVAIPVAVQKDSGNAYAGGGDGGAAVPVAANVQVPVGGDANGGDGSGLPGPYPMLDGLGLSGGGGDGGDLSGNAIALQKGIATNGNATAGDGDGGDADGYAKNSADSTIKNTTTSSADGGKAGNYVKASGSQDADADATNKGNSANAGGGTNNLTSSNTANGGTGGTGEGGNATGGTTAERTVGSNTKAISDIDSVTASVSVGGASGDPCKQIIKDSVGVMAVNGVNDIKSSVMQNVNANLGNAANTSVNLGELVPQNREWGNGYPTVKNGNSQSPGVNINVNPNTNQNTNIISF